MKFLHLGAALAATVVSFIPGLSAGAAQEADYACFMTTQSGQVIDLSESVCKIKTSALSVIPLNKSDQAFKEDYKRTVMRYPDVRDKLLATAEKSPQQSITEAKNVCDELKTGLSLEEVEQIQASENFESASIFNVSVINSLATKYYCPEFSQ
jgi:hypothetical protein